MGTKVLLHVEVKPVDLGTVKPRRQETDVARSGERIYCCCCFTGFTAGAADGLVPRPSGLAAKSASEMPVMPTNRAAKTRRLKKADREVDFFFMNDYEVNGVWM